MGITLNGWGIPNVTLERIGKHTKTLLKDIAQSCLFSLASESRDTNRYRCILARPHENGAAWCSMVQHVAIELYGLMALTTQCRNIEIDISTGSWAAINEFCTGSCAFRWVPTHSSYVCYDLYTHHLKVWFHMLL